MFVINKFKKLLVTFGMLKKEATILLLGLENSGKATLLHMLLDDPFGQHYRHPSKDGENFILDNILFKAFDKFYTSRKRWKDYMEKIDGVVFLVDSADPESFDESKEELKEIIKLNQKNVPILILGNKIDKPHAATEVELREVLGITENQFISQDKHQMQIHVFMCSTVKRVGYIEGLKWLSQFIV